jgi:hypothetical protein
MYFNDFLHKEINNTQIVLEIHTILQSHNICPHIILKISLKKWLNDYNNHDMCGMVFIWYLTKNMLPQRYLCPISFIFNL